MARGFHITALMVALGLVSACLQREANVEPAPSRSAALAAANAELRAQASALRTENARLASQVDGAPRWRGTHQLGRVGLLRGRIPYLRLCPAGALMTGLRGTSGALIDSLVAVCTPTVLEPSQSLELEVVGGARGTPFRRACPEGAAIVGLRGRAGEAVDAIEPICGPVGQPAVAPTALEAAGGPSGGPFERRCPEGHYVVGISGWYFSQLESLSLHCVDPSIQGRDE